MEDSKKENESFSEKLDQLIHAINLDVGTSAIRDNMKNELIKMYTSKNSNNEKLAKKIKEIQNLDSSLFNEKIKNSLIEIAKCGCAIANYLDSVDFNNYHQIQDGIDEIIKKSKEVADLNSWISETQIFPQKIKT